MLPFHPMHMRKNLSLILGVSIPLLMILAVILSVVAPNWFAKPTQNFVYIMGQNEYYVGNRNYKFFEVRGGQILRGETPNFNTLPVEYKNDRAMIPEMPRLYVHDVKENRSKEVTPEEAEKLSIDPSIMSRDGFEVRHGRGGGDFFIFDGGYTNYNEMYIVGHHASLKLNLTAASTAYYYGSNEYRFLGWIN